jgi:ferredoxin-type protein NapH
VVQLTIIVLYFGANAWGWKMLTGNLSHSKLFKLIPLTDPYTALQTLCAGAIIGTDALIGVAVIVAFYATVGGRAFCSWVCPVNIVTDAAAWSRRALRIDEVERKVWISRNIRYWVLGLSIPVSFALGVAAFEMVSPIGILSRGLIFGAGIGAAVIVGVFLFDMFAIKNGFCGHICPLGGFYALLGRFSLLRVKHDHIKCTSCMKCTEICPEKPVLDMIGKRSEFVSKIECTSCGRCIDVCNDDALGFSIRNFTENNEKILRENTK